MIKACLEADITVAERELGSLRREKITIAKKVDVIVSDINHMVLLITHEDYNDNNQINRVP